MLHVDHCFFHIARRFPGQCVREEGFIVKGSLLDFVVDCRYLLTTPSNLVTLPPFYILTSPVPFSGSNSTLREDMKVKLKIGFLASIALSFFYSPRLWHPLPSSISFQFIFFQHRPFSGEVLMVNLLSFLPFLFSPFSLSRLSPGRHRWAFSQYLLSIPYYPVRLSSFS